jgi:hypothetical protein
MKTIVLIPLLLLSIVAPGYCTEEGRGTAEGVSEITCNFKIPSGWKEVRNDVYVLKDLNKTLREWDKFLSEGHQPWRLEPTNTAAACLWDFGIEDNSRDIFKFAERLTTISENRLYMLKVRKSNYYVFVRVYGTIPIAYKLMIFGD